MKSQVHIKLPPKSMPGKIRNKLDFLGSIPTGIESIVLSRRKPSEVVG